MQRLNENLDVVQGFFNQLEARDKAAVLAAFDDAAYWDTPSGGPFSGRFVSKAGLSRLVQLLMTARPEGHVVTGLTLHAGGDRVFAEFTWAPLSDSAPRTQTRSLAVFELAFGKIAAVREFEAGPPASTRGE